MAKEASSAQKRVLLTSASGLALHPLATVVHDLKNKLMPILVGLGERDEASEEGQLKALTIFAESVRDKVHDLLKLIKDGVAEDEAIGAELSALSGRLKFVLDHVQEKPEEKYMVPRETLEQAVEEFEALIERGQLLHQSQPYEDLLAPGNISDYTTDIVRDYQRRHPWIIFCANIEPDCEALFHPFRLKRALENLLNNAIQALPKKGGIITVRLNGQTYDSETRPFAEVLEGDYISIQVTDNGSGIAEEILMKLRFSSITTKEDGSGIGLESVRKSIIRHKGHLYIESEEGQGATVTVLVPSTFPPPARTPKIG